MISRCEDIEVFHAVIACVLVLVMDVPAIDWCIQEGARHRTVYEMVCTIFVPKRLVAIRVGRAQADGAVSLLIAPFVRDFATTHDVLFPHLVGQRLLAACRCSGIGNDDTLHVCRTQPYPCTCKELAH
eukprot:scaffold52472_cov69-Phaeocystis_antarctica.AAC.4